MTLETRQHLANCPAIDGFGCRCESLTRPLPETLVFNGLHQPGHYYSARCYFRLVDYREPRPGEWFIAAEVHGTAYKAPFVEPNSRGERGIVVPTFYAVPVSSYVPGAPVT